MSDAPLLLGLPNDIFRHIVSFLTDFEHGPFAASCTAAQSAVRAHRHGVVVQLPPGRRPSQQQLLAAFGLKAQELPTGAMRIGRTLAYDLKTALPQILERVGGWAGVVGCLARAQVVAAVRKRKREDGERAREERRTRLRDWLARVWQIASLDEYEALVGLHKATPPEVFTAYITRVQGQADAYDAVVEAVTRQLMFLFRKRELHAALLDADCTYSDFDMRPLRGYERGATGVKTAVGLVAELLGRPWSHQFYQRPLVMPQ